MTLVNLICMLVLSGSGVHDLPKTGGETGIRSDAFYNFLSFSELRDKSLPPIWLRYVYSFPFFSIKIDFLPPFGHKILQAYCLEPESGTKGLSTAPWITKQNNGMI